MVHLAEGEMGGGHEATRVQPEVWAVLSSLSRVHWLCWKENLEPW